MAVSVSDIGEFGLIQRLEQALGQTSTPDEILISIGDDAAAWLPASGTITVATTDALVEGVHFDLATTSWVDLGWKALAENVSDIAAMGCLPRYGLLALGLPPTHLASDAEALYRGVAECARAFHCQVIGGDIVRSPCVILQVTLIGESLPMSMDQGRRPLLERSRARPGDVLAVSGPLGGSAAGLRLLMQGGSVSDAADDAEHVLVRAHQRPQPRVDVGLALVESGIRCAIDVSDGLVADVGHICERSGVDVEIDAQRVPILPEAQARFGDAALDLALSGGEDYELACAGDAVSIARASALLVAQAGRPLVPIGVVTRQVGASPAVRVRGNDGVLRRVDVRGYEHFHG